MMLRGMMSLRRVVDTRVTDGGVFGKAVSCFAYCLHRSNYKEFGE